MTDYKLLNINISIIMKNITFINVFDNLKYVIFKNNDILNII